MEVDSVQIIKIRSQYKKINYKTIIIILIQNKIVFYHNLSIKILFKIKIILISPIVSNNNSIILIIETKTILL
jgi:hypothetical protein